MSGEFSFLGGRISILGGEPPLRGGVKVFGGGELALRGGGKAFLGGEFALSGEDFALLGGEFPVEPIGVLMRVGAYDLKSYFCYSECSYSKCVNALNVLQWVCVDVCHI